uniref:PHD-type domain-containing protein n=1 Tax=Corvus moneduloides TaxID=1196302 RepID=A0A8U7P2J0_CORMO
MPESQVRAKQPSRSLAQGLSGQPAWGPERRQGEAGAAQPCWGWEPPSSPRGAQLGRGQLWGRPCPRCPLLPKASRPAHQPGRQGQSSPWGRCCGLRAPQRCSCPVPLALSPAACLLCRRAEADPDICGDKREKHGLRAHVFCLVSCTGPPSNDNRTGLMGFRPRDIQLAVSRAAQKHCCVCGETGATIMCCQEDCDRWFHLPCAKHGACVTQYIAQYSAYCPEHRPHLELGVTPEPETECAICMETVDDRETYGTMVCPACKRAWFHRDCIQVGAIPAAPGHNIRAFLPRMFIMGIRIPFRLVSFWLKGEGTRRAQLDNPELWRLCLQCHEPVCFPRPWELLLCSSCAAEGSHRRCSGLRNSTASWECDSCAGLGTGMRQSTRASLGWGQCPGWAWQSPCAPGGLRAPLWPGPGPGLAGP